MINFFPGNSWRGRCNHKTQMAPPWGENSPSTPEGVAVYLHFVEKFSSSLSLSFHLFSFSRFPHLYSVSVTCDLLWSAADKGEGATNSSVGGSRANETSWWWQRQSRISRKRRWVGVPRLKKAELTDKQTKTCQKKTAWLAAPLTFSIFGLANCTVSKTGCKNHQHCSHTCDLNCERKTTVRKVLWRASTLFADDIYIYKI